MKLLNQAILLSLSRTHRCNFKIVVVGFRADGVIVSARSGGAAHQYLPQTPAEARLARKLTPGSTVYVARTLRSDFSVAMAKPCQACQNVLRHRGVKRVVYTISKDEYGVILL